MVNEVPDAPIPDRTHQVHCRQLANSTNSGPLPDPLLQSLGRYGGREEVNLGHDEDRPWNVPGLSLLPGPGILLDGGGNQPSDLSGEGAVEIDRINDHQNDGASAGRGDHLGADHAVEVEVGEEVLGGGILDAAVMSKGVTARADQRPRRLIGDNGVLLRHEMARFEEKRQRGAVYTQGASAVDGGAVVRGLGGGGGEEAGEGGVRGLHVDATPGAEREEVRRGSVEIVVSLMIASASEGGAGRKWQNGGGGGAVEGKEEGEKRRVAASVEKEGGGGSGS